jgi:urease beta subunit
MDRSITLILVLTLCLLSGDFDRNGIVNFDDFAILADNWLKCADSTGNFVDQNNLEAVMIVLTKFEVNDKALELSYKIKNDSDHDIWVCDYITLGKKFTFEVFLAEDNRTLLMRRGLDVPTELDLYVLPTGKYVRLGPGQERSESLSITVPIQHRFVYTLKEGKAEYATRLVIQVGFYAEDLPEMVIGILGEAEKITHPSLGDLTDCNLPVIERYFGGLLVEYWLGGLSGFKESNKMLDLSEQVLVGYTYQALKGERFSELVIDGVSVPYRPLPAYGGEKTGDPQGQQAISTRQDKPDAEKVSDRDHSN